ncbi:MAG: FAD:protein FMN transferase, partial [Fibrobacteria bacterium]|nr:FAD:protein FMN transferase [Fibrobacteria bacterium]
SATDSILLPVMLLDSGRVVIQGKDVLLDLGAVVKGYTADRFSRILDSLGFPDHMIMVGGEVRVAGTKPEGLWRVGVMHPRAKGVLAGVISAPGGFNISTSGDYERFFIRDGKRYHHIFDPRNGYPAREYCSVTVLARAGMVSDALSTSLFVLGPLASRSLRDYYQVDAVWLKETDTGLCAIMTDGLAGLLELDADIRLCGP